MITPTCKVSTAGLNAAISERLRYPGRTEAQAVNTSAYWIAVNTKNATPHASIEAMDADLGKFVIPKTVVTKTGELKARRMTHYGAGASRTVVNGKPVPLGALIIAARVKNPPSHSKWQVAKNPFAGVSRLAGARAMTRLITKMLKARHSSAHFLQSGWVKAVQILKQYAISSPSGANRDTQYDYELTPRGDATVATEGANIVFAQIINDTGAEGVDAVKVDDALHRYGTAPLQAAIDRERTGLLKKIEQLSKPRDEKFNRMAR